MSRVKRGVHHSKRRRGILLKVKGFEGGRKKLMRVAKVAATKAGGYAYKDRKIKKRTARALWNVKINAALDPMDLSYSKFIGMLKAKNVLLDRKILSTIAASYPEVFKMIVTQVK
ncbi:MAG: 50S ribosomal protein L20 [Candidatus Magasanikbacteria bacterium RIFCSPHIGHO2_01_FULL_41_23]|uniref:Large ribosomal subunit protein bL20 n=1 Tax=Candidatus Magasanikbacteria bacterium RIFCSPLOWO2_01_FULL_40_15 TaxID=1798686 RepID=A0A1F6N247_9BACT|nr:MAG: 50S ribosomal protein L20 [Candidatus Magasanikbacteria bacterium RIFCSPHIGHO2_01_FULL_41_23]OGH67251.1 MAG: 50S ribosomal protein L20 [Candidatus Magasanikbacteria bacterium RIFCSPHIGHO2_02_FULL_41_35]OGH74796.1 MAG: 50S ribosomal protein L20 [Candidatus Magasanikbacteria bacterium RIFCSPHIGHO2_12_FULL_41_16]OGH77818.1 MAG: 50S ribosomal protein L20 [Candidatus Magasanikbacteria bacterium RIFCSPLOWO2_01_FULL_40_15]